MNTYWLPTAQAKLDAVDGVLSALAGGNRDEIAWRTRFKELVLAAEAKGIEKVNVFGLQDRAKKEVKRKRRTA